MLLSRKVWHKLNSFAFKNKNEILQCWLNTSFFFQSYNRSKSCVTIATHLTTPHVTSGSETGRCYSTDSVWRLCALHQDARWSLCCCTVSVWLLLQTSRWPAVNVTPALVTRLGWVVPNCTGSNQNQSNNNLVEFSVSNGEQSKISPGLPACLLTVLPQPRQAKIQPDTHLTFLNVSVTRANSCCTYVCYIYIVPVSTGLQHTLCDWTGCSLL